MNASASAPALWQRYQDLKQQEPRLRARDAARRLGVSEAELVAADPSSVMLRPEWARLLGEVETLGSVMTLTRNEAVVHEKTGVYANVSIEGEIGLALNPDIDLRFFLRNWHSGFATGAALRSLQFFDRHGEAVHKIFLKEASDAAAYDKLVHRYRDSQTVLALAAASETVVEKLDEEVDVAAFRLAWQEMKDTHEFFPLLRRFGLARLQALHLAPPGYVHEVDTDAVSLLLHAASESGLNIMVFAGNHGCLQIHTGPVKRIVVMDTWLNVLDPGFNLHVQTALLKRAFLVRKPTRDGIVSSLECYDAAGEMVLQFFGERKPGRPELPAWTALLQRIGEEEVCHAC